MVQGERRENNKIHKKNKIQNLWLLSLNEVHFNSELIGGDSKNQTRFDFLQRILFFYPSSEPQPIITNRKVSNNAR